MAWIYRTVAPVASARRCISSSALLSQRSYRSSAALVTQRPPAIPAGALLRSSVATAGPPEGVLELQPGHRRFGTSSSLGSFRGSPPRRGEHVMELPGLGDSISEGTVVEWRKSVGDEVSEDEVIAVVETDKVSVDVRSTHVGVVVKLFAAVDDVVEVGKPLCTIDGDEASVVKARVQAQQDEEDANAPPPELKKPSLEDAMAEAFMAGADFVAPMKKRHKPLIKFVGKRALLTEKKDKKEEDGLPARHRHSPGALDFSQIVGGAMFGRPAMSEEEMEAVDSGGAEAAPQLRYIDGSRWAS